MKRVRMPGMISEKEMAWVKPAMDKFRRYWGNRGTDCSKATGVPKATVYRWLSGEHYPSPQSLPAFKRACVACRIEVGD